MAVKWNAAKFDAYIVKVGAPRSGKPVGSYASRLTASQLESIAAFGAWLTASGTMKASSIACYRTYVAQAMCAFIDGTPTSELSASVKTAMRRYAEFTAQQ